MIFETHALRPPLSEYIASIFHFKAFSPDHSIERVVPTGHVFLIFELDDMVRNTFHNDTLQPKQRFSKVWISGMHRHYISISAHQQSEMFVVQFNAFGAHPFFHLPMQELTEKVVPAEVVLGKEILDLREALYQESSSIEKFALAEQWLHQRFAPQKTAPAELLAILEKLQQESANNYQAIAGSYPKTQKHLIDQFKKHVGLTPKYYQRILRFNELLGQIKNKENLGWSQIAYQCGYADQSHFIKEFKHFSGFNPTEFIQQDFHQDPPNFFPLDRKG